MTNDCNVYMFRENVAIGMSVIDADAVCVISLITTTMNAAKASVIVIANRGTISPLHESCQGSIRYLSYTHTCQTALKNKHFEQDLPTNIVTLEDASDIEPPAMTGVNDASITAVCVVDNVKRVWNVAVVVIASDSWLRSFGSTSSKSD